jgi:hypothetical protein
MRQRRMLRVGVSLVVAIAVAAVVVAAAAAGDGDHHKAGDAGKQTAQAHAAASSVTVSTVASGLDNPRGLAFGPDGALYLAEAGHGGSNCIPGGNPGGGDLCVGATSRISRIDPATGARTTFAEGFASGADAHGFGATGLDGISWVGNTLYGIITGAPQQFVGAPLPGPVLDVAKRQLGQLVKVTAPGVWSTVAGVGRFDYDWAAAHKSLVPDQFPDANPYAVLALPNETWVVDAASNTLDRVGADGAVQVEAFFPNPPVSDAVPTCIDRGPDGALYIGQLTGAGNAPGSASIWRWTASTGLQQWATGLTAVTGCGFGKDGNFYAVEFSKLGLVNAAPGTGALMRVPSGSSTPITVVDDLNFPGGFAAGSDGSLYFSNWSIAPAATRLGAVERVQHPS